MAATLWLSKTFVVGVLLALTPPAVGQGSDEGASVTMSSTGAEEGPISSAAGSGSFEPMETDSVVLTDTCNQKGYDAHYEVYFSGSGDTMVRQASSDTGCPNHVNYGVLIGNVNHFSARNIATNTSIPAFPMLQPDGNSTSLSTAPGNVGILVNGVSIYGPWARDEATDYTNTAFAIESFTYDACGAHSTEDGWYHYHNTPGCLQEQVMKLEGLTFSDPSPLLGWSHDGFPVYGHLGPEGTSMLSCGTDGAHETYCLDECNGYEGLHPEVDKFIYRYYLTCGDTESYYPVTVGCYRGCCPEGIECDKLVESCSTDATAGYTDDYTPELGSVVTDQYEVSFLEGPDAAYINSSSSVDCPAYYGETTVTQTPIAAPTMMPLAAGETPSPVSTSSSTIDDGSSSSDTTDDGGSSSDSSESTSSPMEGSH